MSAMSASLIAFDKRVLSEEPLLRESKAAATRSSWRPATRPCDAWQRRYRPRRKFYLTGMLHYGKVCPCILRRDILPLNSAGDSSSPSRPYADPSPRALRTRSWPRLPRNRPLRPPTRPPTAPSPTIPIDTSSTRGSARLSSSDDTAKRIVVCAAAGPSREGPFRCMQTRKGCTP